MHACAWRSEQILTATLPHLGRPPLSSTLARPPPLYRQPPVVDVAIPQDGHVTVCGDVHGQYYDLCNIFEMNGLPCEVLPSLPHSLPLTPSLPTSVFSLALPPTTTTPIPNSLPFL